jgi:ATP adenylyltransferase
VENLLLFKGENGSVSLNLYPYNPGHLMIFPNRHLEDLRELTAEEENSINRLTRGCLDMVTDLYRTDSFNIGYNMGPFSGASIQHLHLHIVPRYPNELGFADVLAGTKLIVEEPTVTAEKLKEKILDYLKIYLPL